MSASTIKHIKLKYDRNSSEESATKIAYALHPDWEKDGKNLKIKAFSDGITNTMLKISYSTDPSHEIVLRAFGRGAEPLTSRPREIATHALFAQHDLAPALLARFDNGILYAFTPGETCDANTLHEKRIWRGVARALGKWHAVLPVGVVGARLTPEAKRKSSGEHNDAGVSEKEKEKEDVARNEVAEEDTPGDIWAVMRLWASRMPEDAAEECDIKHRLLKEVEWAFTTLSSEEGLLGHKLVMGHCDLLSGNVLVTGNISPEDPADDKKHNSDDDDDDDDEIAYITFIDYEYSVASPAAFDISLHFGEWTGLDCDYTKTPSPSTREAFMREYVRSWRTHLAQSSHQTPDTDEEDDVNTMVTLVDRFRGLPGLWFALWGFVQAHDSSEEFDYCGYARTRLGEYWAWKETLSGEDGYVGPEGGQRESDRGFREEVWWGRR